MEEDNDLEMVTTATDVKLLGLRLSIDNYYAVKELAAKASKAKGDHVSIREYLESNLITPHVEAARAAGLID